MEPQGSQTILLWPLAVYFAAVIGLVASMIGLSALLGQRHQDKATGEPYEAGIVSTGSARLRFSAQYYLVAMFFVIFDLEAAFIFAWAIAVRDLGWMGYVGILIFIGVLVMGLLYEWRVGGLDWHMHGRHRDRRLPARYGKRATSDPYGGKGTV